ncbi:ShlB/FhaC/HecB family hemolysin secretion/activation protein [Rhodoplanes sp. Z2-YC6860]|uniref:ShlB/FhaC/HecB family hemolysin secretion/activation protein n=1 Tax=Rhodoplanes sp. Z2-YC6860 TaxID=674703 RepID=UPI00078E8DF9|nr:ShlB/FhaC/HecB family hemolysin secretion/activation protein [Rhodoplanes sp. Z2-YC6860]AMN41470.1 beta-barrel domain T5SS secretion protein [Rhodoplanes sp. Z2-YC6860]
MKWVAVVCAGVWLMAGGVAFAQAPSQIPSPSQVQPPVVPPAPGGARIALPQVPAGAQIPAEARRLRFKLLGFSVQDEFEELKAQREQISEPLIGKTVTVADVFEFADKLQQIYVRAGFPLARVVILPQEFEKAASIKLRVIDGYIERMDLEALAPNVRSWVAWVLSPLVHKTHLTQKALERQLLIAGEAPGLILNATFAAGKEIGGSILVLTGRYHPVSASLYGDNALPAVFGTGQLVGTAALNSLMGLGEQLTISAAGLPDRDFITQHPTRRYLTGSFLVPIGIDGWKLELGATDGVTTPRVNALVASQGQFRQARAKLSYDIVKLRDMELTASARYEATDEEIDTLAITPRVPLSLDRTRVVRAAFEGIVRSRSTGTTILFATNYSRGLSGLGARTAADADPLLPLSRAGADAVFDKWDGRIEINQSLPENFFLAAMASGQTSFHKAMLTSEQFDITGAKALSGFTSGALPGDTAWSVRGELGRPFVVPAALGGVVLTPYVYASAGQRILWQASAVETASVYAVSYGTGLRANFAPPGPDQPDGYGFIEWSRVTGDGRNATEQSLDGYRLYTGFLLRY